MVEIAVVVVVLLIHVVATALIVKRLLCLGRPDELLVLLGRRHVAPDGSASSAKVVHGGRRLRLPLIESVFRLDLSPRLVRFRVEEAYCRGGVPLEVEGVAAVRVTTDPGRWMNAVERFLGRSPEEIVAVASETLKGALRGALPNLTALEASRDRGKLAEELAVEAGDAFDKLGLDLDALCFTRVSDSGGELEAEARRSIAARLREVELAESEAFGGYRGAAGRPPRPGEPGPANAPLRELGPPPPLERGPAWVVTGAGQRWQVLRGAGRPRTPPLITAVDRLDLSSFEAPLTLEALVTQELVPVQAQGRVVVRVGDEEPLLGAAIERWLRRDRAALGLLVGELVGGVVAEVLASTSIEALAERRGSVETACLEAAASRLSRLGLVVDALALDEISDERGVFEARRRLKGLRG